MQGLSNNAQNANDYNTSTNASGAPSNVTPAKPSSVRAMQKAEGLVKAKAELKLLSSAGDTLKFLSNHSVDSKKIPSDPVIKVIVKGKAIQIAPPSRDFKRMPARKQKKLIEKAKIALKHKKEKVILDNTNNPSLGIHGALSNIRSQLDAVKRNERKENPNNTFEQHLEDFELDYEADLSMNVDQIKLKNKQSFLEKRKEKKVEKKEDMKEMKKNEEG